MKALGWQQVLTVQGSGTTLAEIALNYGTAEKIGNWFREHRDFGTGPQPQPTGPRHHSTSAPTNLVADELMKLAQLRDTGVITPTEFEAQKSKLLN
ncbi:SHOCT domain-containing protein [Nocardia testacea]|uniref:SHOCT domain-containing protein n=1 Tax=Nocardia testacea TaxID=248551 RepID=UPI0033EBD86D